jgi:hypothetical protein
MSSNFVGRYFSTQGVELELDALDAWGALIELVAAIFKCKRKQVFDCLMFISTCIYIDVCVFNEKWLVHTILDNKLKIDE